MLDIPKPMKETISYSYCSNNPDYGQVSDAGLEPDMLFEWGKYEGDGRAISVVALKEIGEDWKFVQIKHPPPQPR